jgi:hypothetical protein
MRKSLWITLAVLVVAVGAPNAHAGSFNATFTVDPCPIMLGSTCLGNTPTVNNNPIVFPLPGDLSFTWDGQTFIFSFANLGAGDSYTWSASAATDIASYGTTLFTITDTTQSYSQTSSQVVTCPIGCPNIDNTDSGTLSFAPVGASVPEPSSVALMLAGIGVLLVTRKSWA